MDVRCLHIRQEAADVMMEALKAIPGQVGQYCLFTVETCAYAARLPFTDHCQLPIEIVDNLYVFSGNVMKIQKMLGVCAEHLEENNSHQAVAALGIALISMGEEVVFRLSDFLTSAAFLMQVFYVTDRS
jgi:26S proteasome regulatory subunit N1